MLDLIIQLFNTIVHAIQTILTIITSIPIYVGYFISYVNMLPNFILVPLYIAFLATVIIQIKRLVF